jgi:hypothetical protein
MSGEQAQRKTAAAKAAKSLEIAERRRMLALMLRSGLAQQEAAAVLGVSEATISVDVAALKEAWARDANEAVEEMLRAELQALDADEYRFRSLLGEARSLTAQLRTYETILSIMHRRSQLAGLDSVLRRKQAEQQGDQADLDALLGRVMEDMADGGEAMLVSDAECEVGAGGC